MVGKTGNNTIVGIRFGDNDFYHTITPFMRNLQQALSSHRYKWESYDELRKIIIRLFNDTALAFYILHQNCYRYDCEPKDLETIKNYLRVGEEEVLVGEEVTDFLLKVDFQDNQEFTYFYALDGDIETV